MFSQVGDMNYRVSHNDPPFRFPFDLLSSLREIRYSHFYFKFQSPLFRALKRYIEFVPSLAGIEMAGDKRGMQMAEFYGLPCMFFICQINCHPKFILIFYLYFLDKLYAKFLEDRRNSPCANKGPLCNTQNYMRYFAETWTKNDFAPLWPFHYMK